MLKNVTSTPLPSLPPRALESHKGDYGRVLLVGGSRGMAGAIGLAGMAALRSGAGLVTLMVPQSIQATVASFEPSAMTLAAGTLAAGTLAAETLPVGTGHEDVLRGEDARAIREAARQATVVALGPGLGRATETARLVHSLYHHIRQPLIVDADGLNALAEQTTLLKSPAGPRVLTPHPGEFMRLAGERVVTHTAGRAEQASRLCHQDKQGRTVVVLKGHQTVICDGRQYAVNSTGNPGMATGGAGDCLTGMIAALIGQGLSPWDAARLGAYLHGLAGDMAAEALGPVSMIASDLIRYLPEVFTDPTARSLRPGKFFQTGRPGAGPPTN